MIITQILGGLGNQMFQYAFGRSLALRHNERLKLDTQAFSHYKLHAYGLNHLGINAEIAMPKEIAKLAGPGGYLGKALDRVTMIHRRHRIVEPHFHFAPACLEAPAPAYAQGYWQTEKYFQNIAPLIRQELSVATPPSEANAAMLREIRASSSVALHIRRGDYVTNAASSQHHGTCSLDYYSRGLKLLEEKVGQFRVFVFSDDPAWVKENLNTPYATTYVDLNGPDRNYEDLRLMYSCQHQLIANSTFSWWGAWLNQYGGKVVIAPEKWFRQSTADARDLIPATWIRI